MKYKTSDQAWEAYVCFSCECGQNSKDAQEARDEYFILWRQEHENSAKNEAE